MAVLSKDIGRMDILLHRNSDESVGVQWHEDKRDGAGYQIKDIRNWSGVYQMYSDNKEVYSTSCTTTSLGCAICEIPSDAFISNDWDKWLDGTWKITVHSPDGSTQILGHGYYRIV